MMSTPCPPCRQYHDTTGCPTPKVAPMNSVTFVVSDYLADGQRVPLGPDRWAVSRAEYARLTRAVAAWGRVSMCPRSSVDRAPVS